MAHPIDLSQYQNIEGYYGKICGKHSGRIDKANLNLNDKFYNLEKNRSDISKG